MNLQEFGSRFPLGAARNATDHGAMNVIDINEHRRSSDEPSYDGLVCECGGAWFSVDAVCMTREGHITGHTGNPRCVSCGKRPGYGARGRHQ
jgi:hypothetical protein